MAPNPRTRPCRVEYLRPLLGPRNSSSKRLTPFSIFGSSNSEPLPFGVNTGRNFRQTSLALSESL
eukprot:12621497-Alexandrium_andersonii.AAC.1